MDLSDRVSGSDRRNAQLRDHFSGSGFLEEE
jgi:hypothetical protein